MARPVVIAKAEWKTNPDTARKQEVSRIKRFVPARKKRRKVLKEAKGYTAASIPPTASPESRCSARGCSLP